MGGARKSEVSIEPDNLIQGVSCLNEKKLYERLDVAPFVVLYSILCVVTFAFEAQRFWALVGFGMVVFCHLSLLLVIQWSVQIRKTVWYKDSPKIIPGCALFITAAPFAGCDKLSKIEESRHSFSKLSVDIFDGIYHLAEKEFRYQNVVYLYNSVTDCFKRLDYPVRGKLESILSWRGHGSNESVAIAFARWGPNEFDIPYPEFIELFKEHLVAPFFVFQVVCLLLWSLDDYWYYSFMTLVMLLVFEGMMCRQRQASLTMLRGMLRPPSRIHVYRKEAWTMVSSDTLLPGDVISLSSFSNVEASLSSLHYNRSKYHQESQKTIPCDAIIIRGSCVVNEAMLTGESLPQVKETVGAVDCALKKVTVDLGTEAHVDPLWRRYMVFGGTSLMQHTELMEDVDHPSSTAIPMPPDRGCIAVVVRTGFGSSQGGLIRKILFASENLSSTSSDTFRFIGLLVVIAVAASATVLYYGLQDSSRSRFKLILHCIMIVTSVVPPELPMELSLSVSEAYFISH